MRKRIRQAMVKLLALVLVLILTFPSEIVAQSLNGEQRDIYTKDSSLMGVNEKDEDPNSRDKFAQNEKTLLQSDILKENLEKLDIEKSVSLSKTTGEIIYKILIKAKDENNLSNLQTIFALNKNSKQNDLHIQKITSFDENGNEVEIDAKENKPFFQSDEIQTLSSTSQVEGKSVLYYLSSKIDDETLEEIRAGENYQFALDLLIKNENQEILHQERLAFRNIDKNKENLLDPENPEIFEKENQALDFDLEFIDDIFQVAGEYIDNSKNLLSGKTNEINWTDFIFPNSDSSNEALNYKLIVDENQDTTDSLIKVDFYEASDEGFVINKTYSQEITYTEETELQIPQGFIAKIALTTKVKEGANPKEFTFNNKIIANPSYKEESETPDEENKTEEKSEDPLPEEKTEENKEEEKKENSDKKENTEKSETKVEEEKPSDSKDEKEKQTSPIDLNKDALINKYQSQEKLSEELKAQIEEITKSLNSYNEEKITEEEFKINLKENSKDINKEEFKEILQSLIAGLNEEKFKVANLPIDEIIGDIYKEDSNKEKEKEKTNLEKADQELKAALGDEKNGIEEIQNLLTSLGEKYQLSREDQEKLMTENDAAIKALVEKDRNENFRANMLRQLPRKVPSKSWDDKLFHINLEMNVKASPANPIPAGWYFDVQLGDYLTAENQFLNPLYDGNRLIASPVYDEAKHTIRYVFQTSVTKPTTLKVDQMLGFDLANIGQEKEIDIDIKVAPKNNPIQSMTTKNVKIDDESPVESSYNVVSQGQSDAKTYPFQLNWTSDQKYNGGSNPTVEWNIEVDTASLKANDLDFNNLNVSIFAGAEQGLKNFKIKASTNKEDLNDTGNYLSSGRLGEILQKNTSIAKGDLGEKLYIRVKAEVNKNRLHDYYSIGLRINPDGNYIEKMLAEFTEEFNKLPAIIKWMRGAEQAKEFAKLPFNLVETMIPAKSTERDNFTSENLYYDSSRTIYAKRDSDTDVDWYALDLLRLGEKPDQGFNNPEFLINNTPSKQISPKVFYYVPQENGLYRRTPDIGAVVTEYNDFYPGTLISYEYDNQKGTRDDTYRFNANIKEKKVNNLVGETTTGGPINLFTKKVSNKDLTDKYLAYLENPYPIMRINKNFDMVQCFNKGTPDPSFKGSDGIFLDIHEDPSGDYLISRLNENVGKKQGKYKLVPHLNGTPTEDGIVLNPNGMSQGQAMEDLMKRIYFYGEEVKKEYTQGKFDSDNTGEIMHRLIENSMYQRVLHHFTDGISISEDFFDSPKGYNDDSWKFNHTLTGSKNPNGTWSGDQFIGTDESRKTDDGLRKLKDKETIIRNYPIVKNTQEEMAQKLLNKVIASYKEGSDWDKNKASTVQLVFYSHTKEGEYQELITGRVTEPLEIDKYTNDGTTKLEGAKFTFINKYTNEKVEWTSKKDNNEKLYLKPGYYRVQEEAPSGYQPIKEFEIQVKRNEVHPDHGQYNFKGLPDIHVNDGYETEVKINEKDIPKSADDKDLVEIDKDNKVKVKLTNIQDNLGEFEFVKKNEFAKLNGAEFTLRKVTAESVEDVKNQIKAQKEDPTKEIKYDDTYNQKSTGYYGQFKFEQIPAGFYILEETKVPAGYQKAPLYILEAKVETVAGKNEVVLHFVGDNIPDEKEDNLTIVRNYPKETEIEFRKIREILEGEEKQGLDDARFRLESLWTKDGSTYLKDLTSDSIKKEGGKENEKGYFLFDKLKVGDYKLTEIQAPYGYQVLDSYWRIEVREGENGELVKTVYEVKKDGTEVKIDPNKEPVYELTNKPRTIDVKFTKYLGELEKDEEGKIKLDKDGKPIVNKKTYTGDIPGKGGKPVSFDLYSSDFYGAIIGEKVDGKIKPIQTGITRAEDGFFHLKGLEFGKYYVLRETNPPEGYNLANDILLKVEAEAIASVGDMKVIVRDPNTNADTGEHSIFKGVIDFREGEQLGKFSIRKTGNAISYVDKDGKLVIIDKDNPKIVGLRRAYFRLYTANNKFEIEKNGAFAKEYIQKVTPGNPIILYLTEEKAKTMSQEDLNKLGVVGYKNFKSKDGKEVSYAVDKDGKRFRIGEDPSTLPANQGIVTFDNLKPGYYVLQEFRGPAGYEKTTDEWYVYVDEAGRTYRSDKKFDPETLEQGIQSISSITNPSMSPRLQMAGLDISEPIQFNNLMQAPSNNPKLQAIEPYNIDSANANIEVSAGEVDTTDGSRDITVKITPKTKQTGINKSHWVLLVDRTRDWSAKNSSAKLDDNINKFITDLRAKADTPGAEVYLSIIEYSGLAKHNRLVLSKTNIKDLDNAEEYSYKMGTLEMLSNGQYNLNEENVRVKNYLKRAGVDDRSTNVNDGAAKLQEIVNANIENLASEDYDHKHVINFATFTGNNAERNFVGSDKFLQFESMWAFHLKGYKRVYFHQDQMASELNGKIKEYSDYINGNADIKELYLTNKNVVRNKDYKKPREFAPYVQKEKLDSILNDTNNFASQGQEESLLKDGILNISTNDKVKLNSYSISKNGNPVENQTNPTSNSINKNINLGIGESLELTYKIKLGASAADNTEYVIHKLMTYKSDANQNAVNLDPNKLITLRENSTPPTPNTYKVIINSSENGSVSATPTSAKAGETITLSATPAQGYKFVKYIVTANGQPVTVTGNTFTMPASDVTVSATFVEDSTTPSEDNKTLEVNFTYSGSVNGNAQAPGTDSPGRLELFEEGKIEALETIKAVNEGKLQFNTKLDPNKNYRLVYTREDKFAKAWALPNVSNYKIDSESITKAKDTVSLTIANGNTLDIFNKDETGFRIPLRITKVNENNGVLTGAQFSARKILKGEAIEVDGETKYPQYYEEEYDGFSEATGLPGDNYFRELSPGLYELSETKAPSGAYRLPKDENGKDKKWYFKVVIAKDENGKYKNPADDDYMKIEFQFTEKLPATKTDPRWALNEVDDDLVGKEIHGIKLGDGQYDKFTQIIKDDHRSDPARPDAPYKGIDDVKVTNFLKTTEISFHKKDLATYQNIEKAEFTLKRAKLGEDGNLIFDNEGNPQYENLDEKVKGDDGKEYDKFIKPEGYDKTINGVKKVSKKDAEVIFSNLEQGTYILKETKPADGYKLSDSFLAITLKSDEKEGYWKQEIVAYEKQKGKYVKVENPGSIFQKDHDGYLDIVFNNKDYIDFKFRKIEGVKDKNGEDIGIESSDFRVTQVDEKGNPIPGGYDQPIYSYVNSYFTFRKLGVGRYKLQETRALEKYIKPDPWYFRVVQDPKTYKLKIVFEDHDASIRFTPENETDGKETPKLDEDGNPIDIKVANYQKTKFVFKKQNQDGKILPDVYFNLKKLRQTFNSEAYDYDEVSGATYTYNKSARSQRTGSVTFDTLGEGIYELRETDKPEGYDSKAIQDRWIIKVEKTENGLQAIYDKGFEKQYYEKYANHNTNPNKEKDNYYTTYIKNGFDKKSNLKQEKVGEFNYVLTNTKTTTDLKWKKVNQSKDVIKDKQTKFIMLKNSDDPTNLKAAKDGNSSAAPYELIETDGTFEVTNLSKGIYTLIETQAPDGYKQMKRQIVIQIYEDANDNYKLKKKFYEMKKDGNDKNVLVEGLSDFSYVFTRNNDTEVDIDGKGYFYVANQEKQEYFYLTKGFLTDSNGKKVFNKIEKGELHLKLTNTEDDKDVFRTTIDLAKPDSTGYYRFDVNGIKTGKTYLLEEEKAPNGYKLSKNKYRIQFINDTQNPGKVIAILKAVIGKDGKELKNEKDQLILEDGTLVSNFTPGKSIKVVNEKNKVEFTKYGKDKVKDENGKFVDKEEPLKDVEFILQKQDPKDWNKDNKGYYPVTKDIEFIKKDEEGLYIEKSDGTKKRKAGLFNVTIDNSAYKGTSDDNGKFTFEGLTDGFYQVIEPNAPDGYMQVNGPVKKFRVLEGKIYIYDKVGDNFIEKEVTDANIGTLGKIVNEKPGKGEFKIKKVDENNKPLANVKYTLHKTDENETQVGEERITDENGEISFKDLPYGYYWLKETKTLDGYILDTKKKLIALGGGDWGKTPARKDDVSKYITFDGDQKELISTADIPNSRVVYPNKAEGMIANFKFKIDPNKEIRPGDYFTIDFSDNIDLDGIFKDNDNKGKNPDSQFDIIGPAGKLAEAKINPDRTSITYTFTKYVGDYRPDFMSMFMQIFPNRRVVDHTQDITVEVNIGNNTDKTNKDYHYSDSININYRGWNDKDNYDGYQNPNVDISSYMLRLDPDNQTFTAIVYYNPWNKNLGNKNISFTADQDIVQNTLSVKTYRKSGWGSHSNGWQEGDLPDSYDVDFNAKNLTHISDFYRYEPRGNTGNTRKIYIPNDNLTQNGYNTNTYVIEIKGKLASDSAKSLKATVEYKNHYVNYSNGAYWYSHTGSFQTWSQFFNPGGLGDAKKELKLLNFKNKIEFVKIDGGVLSNVVDQSSENPESLKDLGIGRVLKGATFKLQKQNGSSWDEVDKSTRISDDNGVFSWEGLAEGKYRVIETVTPDDDHYDLPTKEVSSFKVDEKGNIVEIKNNKQIIENYKKAEIRIRKTDENGQSIEGAEFLLEKDNDDKYTPNIGTLEKDGTILFKNLPAGKYTLTERKAPKGYTKSDAVWKLEVTRDGKVKWLNSFDDTKDKDKMKTVENLNYKQNGNKPENLDTEIIGIDKENKTFRQKITIKAKPSDIKKTKLILESTDPSLKLSQANTKVRLVAGDGANTIGNKDNTSYKVEINNGNSPNLTLKIIPPYKEEDKNKPVGSEQGQTPQEEEKEKYYQFIVDMPYKDEGRVGAKATYQIGTINKTSGKVEFGKDDTKKVLDKYLENAKQITEGENKVNMTQYDGKYLDRDVNLITTEFANKKEIKRYYPQTGGPGVWIGFSLIGLAVMITGVLIYGKKKSIG